MSLFFTNFFFNLSLFSIYIITFKKNFNRSVRNFSSSPLLLPLRQHPGDSRRSGNAMHPRCLAGQRRPADGAIYGWGLQRASRALLLPVAFQAASFLAGRYVKCRLNFLP